MTPGDTPRYELRFQLVPGPEVAVQAKRFADYCVERGAHGAVLFVAAEEHYPGHPLDEEQDQWLTALDTTMTHLRRRRLSVGVNPWSSVGPWDLGRPDRLGFEPLVSATGERASQQASFACPRWRRWITEWYGDIAALGPDVFWLEDDFRLHNHAPLAFGGFEEIMLDRFRKLAGESPSRQEVVEAFLAPGPPHPWRALLQQTWRDTQLEAAGAIGDAVRERSQGRTRMGLMSSRPGEHSIEGRDWQRLFAALGDDVLHRPHFGGYQETSPSSVATEMAVLDQQRPLRPAGTWVAPEIDNWPHTRWSKSNASTWSQLAHATLSGADSLLLCLHQFYGGDREPGNGINNLLDRGRASLNWLAERSSSTMQRRGVRVLWREDASTHLQLRPGATWSDLNADTVPAARYLLRNGIPVSSTDVDSVVMLTGGVVDAIGDDELLQLMSGPLIMDGRAAEIVSERGHADLLGLQVIESVQRLTTSDQPYALETVTPEGASVSDLAPGTLGSVNHQPALTRLAVEHGSVWTSIRTPNGDFWGAGRVACTNRLGGRIITTAIHQLDLVPGSDAERQLAQAAVRFCLGGADLWPMITGGPHLVPVALEADDRRVLFVVNGSGDPEEVVLPEHDAGDALVTVVRPMGEPQVVRPASPSTGSGSVWVESRGIVVMEGGPW